MKKFISILLVLIMVFSMSAMMSYAADTVSFIVASDIHYKPIAGMAKNSSATDDIYSHAVATGQLRYESEAIFDAFLSEAAADDAGYMIISGDLTDSGSEADATAMASKLKNFEDSTGKSVFVIPGNHDVSNIGKQQFINIYGAFGYAEAKDRDTLSASYTVDVDGDYRLLMIDTTAEKSSGYALDAGTVDWIRSQCKKAKSDNKHLIAVMHHNLLQHFAFDFIHKDSVIDDSYGLKELFSEYDVKYTFSGHTHAQDIMQYEGSNGNTIYEVVTVALNLYPVAYRLVDFSKTGVNFVAKSIKKIDTSALASYGISSEAIAKAEGDFIAYAHVMYNQGIKKFFSEKIQRSILCDMFGVTYTNNKEIFQILDKIGGKLESVIQLPIYTADIPENEEERTVLSIQSYTADGEPNYKKDAEGNDVPVMIDVYSLEEIVTTYNGGRMVDSPYKSILDLVALLYEIHITGREGLRSDSEEYSVTINSLSAALSYCLYPLTTEEYGALLKFLVSKFEPNFFGKMPDSLFESIVGGHNAWEQNMIFMAYLLSPFIKSAFTDDDPDDNNVKLAHYIALQEPPQQDNNEPEEDTSLRAKFVAFFDKIAEFFRMIFSVLTFQNIF